MAAVRATLFLPAVAATMTIPTKEIAPGVQMPVISIGTGGLESTAGQQITADWLELGGRGIDDALMYRNEASVAKAIAQSGVKREDLFITTKIPGCQSGAASSIDSDLKELQTNYVDLLLIHFPYGGDCTATYKVLEDYYKQGKAKAIGVSNFKRADLEKIMKVATVIPAVNQIQLNVLEHDDDTIAASASHNITVEAYSPLGRSGHSGDISGNSVIQSVATNHGVSTYQIAMKWILQHGHIVTFQSSSQDHQKADADVFGFTLTDDEMSKLDALQGSNTQLV